MKAPIICALVMMTTIFTAQMTLANEQQSASEAIIETSSSLEKYIENAKAESLKKALTSHVGSLNHQSDFLAESNKAREASIAVGDHLYSNWNALSKEERAYLSNVELRYINAASCLVTCAGSIGLDQTISAVCK